MHELTIWNNGSRKVLFTGTKDDCVAEIKKCYAEMFIEEDSDNPNHFDVFAFTGANSDVYQIEPVKTL